MSPSPSDAPGIRVSDADREVAAARLQQALSDGRLSVAEFEARVAAVYAATHASHLHRQLFDLPGDPVVALPAIADPPPAPAMTAPLELRVGAGGLTRRGDWSVPAQIRVRGAMGSVTLDFSKTMIAHDLVEVELALGTGSAHLMLPEGATADVDGVVPTMGSVRSVVPSERHAGAPHFVVRGRTRMGSVVVRRRRRIAGIRF